MQLVTVTLQIFKNLLPKHQNGNRTIKWYQFKVPVQQADKIVGSIRDFKSIRFIRMLLKDFEEPVVLRFATLELVQGNGGVIISILKPKGNTCRTIMFLILLLMCQ